jgi:hypothetical protein
MTVSSSHDHAQYNEQKLKSRIAVGKPCATAKAEGGTRLAAEG